MRPRGKILASLLALALSAGPAVSAGSAAKGLWVVRYSLTSAQNVRRIADQAARAGVTDLFVQFYARGEAYYPSRIAPTVPTLPRGFDPLKLMVAECKRRGIRLHAWINVYFVWSSDQRPRSPDHAYYKGSRWFAADAGGRSLRDYSQFELAKSGLEGVYLSPASAEVKAYIRSLVQEIILKYDVDGIHLDYVRYGHIDFAYDACQRLGFYQAYTVDPVRFFDGDPRLRPYWDTWYLWRLHQVTELVAWIKSDIVSASPWVRLSAAVKPDPDEARLGFGQDWPTWLANGWLDFAVLMDYSPETKTVVRLAQKALRCRGRGQIYVGLGAWRDSPQGIVDKAAQVRKLGADGVVLFSYDGLMERKVDLERLKQMGF